MGLALSLRVQRGGSAGLLWLECAAMAKAESYNDLIFELGDLARERLANKAAYPRAMDRVFKAEDVVLARREELAQLEQQLNDEDAAYQEFLAQQAEEREVRQATVKQWKKAVDAVSGRVKDLRKKVASLRATIRYDADNVKKAERRHHDLELTTTDQMKLNQSREVIKKMRLALMRKQRDLQDQEAECELVLTPQPGQPGAAGILAHKRLLEMEDEAEERKLQLDATLAELDQAIAAKEEEVRAAEDYHDQALFLLGEECYAQRVSEPMLAPLYPKIDNAK